MTIRTVVWVAICVVCVQWTRLTGRVKGINLKDSTVTILNRDGDLLIVPVDYQVRLIERHDEARDLKHLELDERITLINTPADKPKDESFSDMNPQK